MTLRLDYLSPLPPVRSGISDYSVDLLPHLVAKADVRVLRLPDLPLDPEIARQYGVTDAAESAGEGGRLPLYQMGNNRYHAAIFELASRRPGIVVLHDLVLHHFLLDRTVGGGAWEPYFEELARDHGWVGEATARAVRWGAFGQAAQFELPANRTLLARQRGVLVHGRWAAERLAEDDPRLAVRVVRMPIPLPAEVDAERGRAFRRARGIPDESALLGSFGFQTPIKRTDVAIRALTRPGLESVRLLIAGELSPYARFQELAAKLGVAERVHVTGFLPFDELDSAIAATDLCLNLRYPSAGETSASLLRILAVGRPVVVSEYAEFGDLPAEIALAVPLGADEEERFAELVAARLGSGRAALATMGRSARAHVAEHHAPERAAAAMLAAIEELARLEPPGDLPPVVPRKSSVASTQPRGEIRLANAEGWRPGELRRLGFEISNVGDDVWLPSREQPGGVIFEVQLWVDERNRWVGRPWLELRAPLEPGRSRTIELPIRRPLGRARLVVKPKVSVADDFRPFGEWELEQWL